MNTRAFLLSALIAGVLMAALSSIPIINLLNCLLCLWIWSGAILAVYFYRAFESSKPSLSVGQGVLLGVVAGIVGAVTAGILSLLFRSLGMAAMMNYLRTMPMMNENARPLLNLMARGGFALATFAIELVLYAAFGALGGLIATSLIWKEDKPV